MNSVVAWLDAHEKLSGWAQFFGAMLAILITYLTAFAPTWRRKKQLHSSAKRLLLNAYEIIESYHRITGHFAPFPLSVKAAYLSIKSVADEIDKFPIFELDESDTPYSLARRLVSTSGNLRNTCLFLENIDFGNGELSEDSLSQLREFLEGRLKLAKDIAEGKMLQRPEWPLRDNK